MKKVLFYLLICFLCIPSIVFAEGLEIEYVEPNYNTDQATFVNSIIKPNIFNFTFTPQSKDMGYNIKITNTDDKIYYITNIDYTMNPNVKLSYTGIEKANVIRPGEYKILNVVFTMRNYPESDISGNEVKFFIEYDLAENYVDTSDGEVIGGNNKLDENPPTGLVDYVKIVLPIILVLGISLYFINKKKKIFKTFVFIIIPLAGIIIIKNVNAENTEKRIVISGNIDFKTIPRACADTATTPLEDYCIYYVEVNPNEGLFNGSPNVYKANFLRGTSIDLSDIDRYQYKFVSWNFNGTDTNFTNNILTINGKSLLKANWEYGPYYWVKIDPNGGIYEGSEKVIKFKLRTNDNYTLIDPTRDGYVFYKWNDLSNSHQLIGGHMIVMGSRDITVSARWEGIYELTFDPGADDATVTPTKKEVANLFPYGELPTPERPGYTFDGWYLENDKITADTIFDKDQDSTAIAHWIANTDTKYRVRHWITKIGKDSSIEDSTNYELLAEEVLKGETDTDVTPEVRTMEGFTSPEAQTVNVNGDESRVVNYYYKRNKYTLTLIVPEAGIKEIKYMINGSSTWESTDTTTVLNVDYDSVYKAYGVSANGYSYNLTTQSNPFTGTMKTSPIIFNPTATICPAGTKAIEGAQSCSVCPVGTYSANDGSSTCTTCASGWYNTETGQTKCNICPAGHKCSTTPDPPVPCEKGTYQNEQGQTTCKTCESGWYNTETGQTTCIKCPAGHKCITPPDPPQPCPKGQYQSLTGQTTCQACPGGQYSSSTGATTCDTCLAGTYSGVGSSSCSPCATGTYSNTNGASSCTKCPAGQYQSSTGQTTCGTCTPGTYSDEGASTCSSCPTGTYSNTNGATSCTKCPAGQYQDKTGQTTCGTCLAGTYSDLGASSCTSCPTGTYSNTDGASSCTSCPGGKYQNLRGQTSCNTCTPGTYSTGGATTCTSCPGGQYNNINGATSCTKCSANTRSNLTSGSTSCVACDTGYESSEGSTTCSLKTFTITFEPKDSTSRSYGTPSYTSMQVQYGSYVSNPITISNTTYPRYITEVTCTNGYTADALDFSYLEGTVNNPSSYVATMVIRNNNKLVGSTCTYTIAQIKASDIPYTNSANSNVQNVRDALDDLYSRLK